MATVRDYVFDLIKNDTQMIALGFDEDRMFNNNDADTPVPDDRRFIVFKWGQSIVGMDVVHVRSLQVWVHDAPSDYTVIDSALERVRTVLTSLFGADTGEPRKWVTQFDWELDSDDLDDDIQRTVTRYSQFAVVGSAV